MSTSDEHVQTATPWVGINHLALITNDMDATVRFWHGALEARLVTTIGNASFRHYFFAFGENTTVAFFEYVGRETQSVAKPAGVFDARAGQFDHLSLNLPDEAALHGLRARLTDLGTEVTEVIDHGMVRSIYFSDPNGIALEASYWVSVPNQVEPALDDPGFFTDPDPVPAVIELMAGGLQTIPTTQLVTTAGSDSNS